VHQPLFGWLLDVGWNGELLNGRRIYEAADYSRALWLNVTFAAMALTAVLFLPETYCGRRPVAGPPLATG